MARSRIPKSEWWLVLALCFSAGCQTSSSSTPGPAIDPSQFDHLWKAYTRCMTSRDLDTARRQADLLHQAVLHESDRTTFLPSTLDRYVEKPPTRLAADPRELATACRSHVTKIEHAQVQP
ncbi:hypothetical protein DNFV4_01407 [Nitrospira tepida]|uniref:Lipoprotein n=1 Tax=Nitrospira tepida TaxID=2973512 RepID=A0AA86MXQ0_9BACT|nr:hypothetical protein [Nitrospira tepida]CAI4030975.1 hypothetical protein DNFV4_01407 [Nitrospira tepida]